MSLVDVQVDRIVGPTHHFGGLGIGNVASIKNEGEVSNPAAAALQGLDKMRLVASLGAPQMILPPQRRPNLRFLRRLGFRSSNSDVLRQAFDEEPRVLSATMSCSSMWTANAATVSAAVDNHCQELTMTVANLNSSVHRALEARETLADLRHCFPFAKVAPAMRGGTAMRDEGAANHMRLGSGDAKAGLHVLVYGDQAPLPTKHFARQSRLLCRAVARSHGLPDENTFLLKQHPDAIDAGAFHNDVVAASHHGLMIFHEKAFYDATDSLNNMAERYQAIYDHKPTFIKVAEADLSLSDAISTYLFNSQILSNVNPGKPPVILCPIQVRENICANKLVQNWCDEGVFDEIHFVDLAQSMSGGGGPACLRLRVPLEQKRLADLRENCLWSEELDSRLRNIIREHYPTEATLADLADINFVRQTQRATEEIHRLLRP